ncbi:MAG: hypothetical protein HN726_00475 [Candidatus Magasanikbacteria bacterium]|jgi:tyrosine-specific transport protein|nr:hypothetical protein [Candidatus Magasanikbacteria bacterium]MBT4221104.1 hypothetical protein [Candidatus Magasanikbacteria bacterium]MBT4350552.1 hypothetical protein [Candidatus Magasanikbacteria bacterium]MBT4542149.1 hypothetical protein [Candidatus Magasanikbacteria bacterium]MBT6253271.1 hypothetical protein [Candidatus Magasanikbacteria bacterium]
MKTYNRLQKEELPVKHHGIFRRHMSFWQAVTFITSGTIGAGVLGIPYAVAKVGIPLGLLYIVVIGLLMIGLNLMVGEIAVRTKSKLQLVGFAKKYLGGVGEVLMTVLVYIMLFGVLMVYIIGEGETLSALLGGSAIVWSTLFFICGSLLIYIGLRTIKTVEFILSIGILVVVMLVAAFSAPHIQMGHIGYTNLINVFVPYGVLLFAFHGTTAIPETYALVKEKRNVFKKAIIVGGIINIIIYALFAVVVVGVTGMSSTEIATIGLGEAIGPVMFVLGNIFAILAMGTSFIMAGLALRDSMQWDFKIGHTTATALVCIVPFIFFLAGLRGFITAIDIVGGVFMSLEMLLVILIYYQAKKQGDVGKKSLHLKFTTPIAVLLVVALTIGAAYSVWQIF